MAVRRRHRVVSLVFISGSIFSTTASLTVSYASRPRNVVLIWRLSSSPSNTTGSNVFFDTTWPLFNVGKASVVTADISRPLRGGPFCCSSGTSAAGVSLNVRRTSVGRKSVTTSAETVF